MIRMPVTDPYVLDVPQYHGQVSHRISLNGDTEPMYVTYGIVTTTSGVDDPLFIAIELHDAYGDTMLLNSTNDYSLQATEVRLQNDAPPAPPVLGVFASARAATGSSGPLPQNSAYLFHKRTPQPGRRGRGRMYVPGIPEAEVSSVGALSPGALGAAQQRATDFLLRFNPSSGALVNVQMVVLNSYQQSFIGPKPLPAVVNSLTIDPIIATQRRRLRR
jgi:hypothetical protein